VDQLNQVPGGYKSGDVTQSGSFKVCFGRKGQFTFARFVFIMEMLCIILRVHTNRFVAALQSCH